MICYECGNDEVTEGSALCSDCLEIPLQSIISVRRNRVASDWIMDCWTHAEFGLYDNWQDAYEAALGHACLQHKAPSVCRRKGHAWVKKYSFPLANDMHVCRRCSEVGYEVFGPWPVSVG